LFLCAAAVPAALLAQPALEGNWQGTLDAGVAKLRLAIHVARTPQGGYATTLDSPDQGAMGLPVANTTVTGRTLHLDLPRLGATFDGTLTADGSAIEGRFTQGAPFPMTFRRIANSEAAPARPQTPKPPFPYHSEDVSYANKSAGITLNATLTLPPGAGPFPAAVLVSGSGAHDRDETIFGHKPFLVIADFLTRRGIAVLRADDRPNKAQSNFTGLTGDVLAAVDYLRARKEIDPGKIGVIGHSEGGAIGPLAASQSPDIAFVIMLAGIGVPGEQLLYKQGELVVRSQGGGDAAVAAERRAQEALFTVVRQQKDPAAAAADLKAALRKAAPGLPESAVDAQAAAANSPELRSILGYDPGPVLRSLKAPVLALNGSRDIQVSAEQNLPAIAAALKAGGNPDFTTTELAGLNHLFQTCKTCTAAEYASLEETFSPEALKIIGDWIAAHARK